jgi:integrase
MVIDERDAWRLAMTVEVNGTRFTKSRPPRTVPIPESRIADDWLREWVRSGKPAVRIHDSGDFFADWYLADWLSIAMTAPGILFYAYTKEIEMLRSVTPPDNFRWLASTGGTQDHLISDDLRHADVFPTEAALVAAGYESQAANDLLAILLPTNRVGITANNIRAYNKKIAGRTFSELQRGLRHG